ncbi:hypothetical protein KAFR_0E03270 [Kazachstania africana CBS 2517]|uniref:PCI domain-containing protein n=1 Tax=Kazachstania africana (strain ATCC 22294 / BCRC 22015 / CBS 2517 / CECT 1963 / NBRC 1671 / NRRL Y-8276) TaxID=1071382 RepID=H2AVS9_KAZAF|nr:hypothetical protein KAFR_0E03270 [Kazachstania africana CBS 2517]CCF58479.1 hypothetical protein KAFR_0E03270 [Kazachstania africana CBS 2517]
MSTHEIDTILSTLSIESDDSLKPFFQDFEKFYEQKLWYQLTNRLKEFYLDDNSTSLRLRIYDTFILKFFDRINQFDVVEFLLLSIKNYTDHQESINYLNQLKSSFMELDSKKQRNDGLEDHSNGCLLIDLEIARLYLFQNEIIKSRDILDNVESNYLNKMDTLPLKVINAFYSVNSHFFKLKNDFNNYYYTCLLYLSTLDDDTKRTVTPLDLQNLAYDLSISALLGDKIYNFGELLHHPIMSNISNNSNFEWLFKLLNILTNGDFQNFENLINSNVLSNIPVLSSHENFLRQKICLMTLIESVFSKNIRTLTFDDISKSTHLSKNDVEHLVMRSISLGLLKGSTDQVNEIVSITWVQPRIINFDQIAKMNNRLIDWNEQVTKLGEQIESHGKSIWV